MLLKVQCSLKMRELIALFGKSGAGKTTILRILAGLTTPDFGIIKVQDSIWFSSKDKINIPPQKREIGFVFQDYALFPNMSIEENLLFAFPKRGDKKHIEELLEIVELQNFRKVKPSMLSGGQQQRVALIRALVRNPKILLLDEPFSALDASMSQRLQEELLKIHQKFELTTFFVSHNLADVFYLSQYVLHLNNGVVDRQGTPSEVFLKDLPSGKFRQSGTIVEISVNGLVAIVRVLVGNWSIEVVVSKSEGENLKVGDLVLVSSKAWNPIIVKL
ncbi:sulfate/molybdate ABC transporter ATP-binding protein [Helicobacter pullorum]